VSAAAALDRSASMPRNRFGTEITHCRTGTGAPGEVDAKQLEELGIRVVTPPAAAPSAPPPLRRRKRVARSPSVEWVPPTQSGKPRVITIRCDPLGACFEGQGRMVSVGDEISSGLTPATKIEENLPVTGPW
jgi:hypothetical protein